MSSPMNQPVQRGGVAVSKRLLATGVLRQPLSITPVATNRVVDGSPSDGALPLTELGGLGIGVWEMSPGVATDTEVDEVFIVLSGRGEVCFDDGEVVELRPGVVVRLRAGEHTVWTVSESLRKVYIAG